jgi:signal transduction histidine kinase/ligand-binding sensor domain-containing protein
MRICANILALLAACLPALLQGQATTPTASFRATQYGVEHGLSQGSNYFMLKDSRQFYWFSSYEGLNRFDGRRFHRFYANPNDSTALRGSEVLGMVEDAHGNIWVGTEQCLNRYDRRSGRFTGFFSKNEKGENVHSQTHPFYADSAEVWFANGRDGVVRYDFRKGEKTVVDPSLRYKLDYYFNFRAQSVERGEFWMPQQKGLVHFDLTRKKLDWYFSDRPDNIAGPPSEIFAHCIDRQTAWVGLKQGLFKLDLVSNTYQQVPAPFDFSKNIIYTIRVDKAGRVWLGTADAGVLLFDPPTGAFHKLADLLGEPLRYATTQVAAMNYEPSDNLLWLNTEPNGLDKITLDAGRIHAYHCDPANPAGLNAPVVRCFTEDRQGRIWLGVWDGGVNVFDPKTGRFEHHLHDPANPNTLPNKSVLGICTDQLGRIWAATENGVACYEETANGTGRWRQYYNRTAPNDMVSANLCPEIRALPNGELAVGTNNGLYLLDPVSGVFTPLTESTARINMVRNILYDPQKNWLFATAHFDGFWVFKKENGRWSKIHELLKGIYTNCFHLTPSADTLWVGTSQGLFLFNSQFEQNRLFTVTDGLPSNGVYGILPDREGRLWLSTNRGISCFDPRNNSFQNYSPADGCQGFEYNVNAYFKSSSGEFYFGGVNGFDRFSPSEIQRKHRDVPVYLTDFKLDNRAFPLDTVIGETLEIRLHHAQNTFAIHFTALDWQNEGLPVYRFRLPPFLPEWVATAEGEEAAQFVNVPPGSYRFEVQAAGLTGEWSRTGAAVSIVIAPAFWQTGWFKMLSVLLGIAILTGLAGFYVRTRYRLRLAEAAKAVEAERLRTRIAQDIHDEVGGSLTRISLSAQVAARLPDLSKAELMSRMEKLGADARLAAGQLREIVFAINPDYDQFEEMQAYFRETAREFWAGTCVEPHFDFEKSPVNPAVPPDVKRQLLLIFKEAQNNVAKHAGAQNVWLSFRLEDTVRYCLEIRDDGRGFAIAGKNNKTQGLSGMKRRAAAIGADILVKSTPENGTIVSVSGKI